MECDKLGFTSSEKLDFIQSQLAMCVQQSVSLFDKYPHKDVMDSFVSQLHRCHVLLVVREPVKALDTNDALVGNPEFWKKLAQLVRRDLAGESMTSSSMTGLEEEEEELVSVQAQRERDKPRRGKHVCCVS